MNDTKTKPANGQKTRLDFSLVLTRLEKEIIAGKDIARCRKILARESVWKKLDVAKQLKWTRLAQMAGDVDLALRIFEHINETNPGTTEAWTGRLELLSILDEPNKLAQVLAHSKRYMGEELHRTWLKVCRGLTRDEESDIQEALGPFEKLKLRQASIRTFLDLFSGREDCFARQWVDKAFIASYEEMMKRSISYGMPPKKTTYRMLILRQVRAFAGYLENQEEDYRPFTWEV